MRTFFQQKLEKLQKDIQKMGSTAAEMIELSLTSLFEQRDDLLPRILELEDRVDDYDNRIERRCAKLIATQQPIARDLRIITTAFKIITDVERIGDYSVDIAFEAKELAKYPQLKPYRDFPRMKDVILKMLDMALEAYAEVDIEKAIEVGKMDREVDNLYTLSYGEILDLMKQSPENVERGIRLILVARYLERIADHITNIAERVVYMETGELRTLNR